MQCVTKSCLLWPIFENFFFNFFSNLMDAVKKMCVELEEIGAGFKCVQNEQANLVSFQAELSETFSQQPDAIHPPLHLDCSSVEWTPFSHALEFTSSMQFPLFTVTSCKFVLHLIKLFVVRQFPPSLSLSISLLSCKVHATIFGFFCLNKLIRPA